jgi:hypothetical protein
MVDSAIAIATDDAAIYHFGRFILGALRITLSEPYQSMTWVFSVNFPRLNF